MASDDDDGTMELYEKDVMATRRAMHERFLEVGLTPYPALTCRLADELIAGSRVIIVVDRIPGTDLFRAEPKIITLHDQ